MLIPTNNKKNTHFKCNDLKKIKGKVKNYLKVLERKKQYFQI